ncbi:zf-C2HC5-domain-containing protein [Trichodelitschia bisporula]|uniref:Zf-C2HC5-domain-containing protein n=1 Tax=Trichodelitschia bisporula TaxID=703511 RepID=A0A6G1I8H4_9PEZI|nr:zf-C2HC5-domain-containing protein [Trichodelitschia bisporula]
MALHSWALPKLASFLPLDSDSLSQILTQAESLSKPDAAEHFKSLLGDSPAVIEFISAFNSRRPAPRSQTYASASGSTASSASRPTTTPSQPSPAPKDNANPPLPVPKKGKKKKAPLNALPPPRRPDNFGNTSGGYLKPNTDEDYMSSRSKSGGKNKTLAPGSGVASKSTSPAPSPLSSAPPSRTSTPAPQKLPPSAAGRLISDPQPKPTPKPKSKPKPATAHLGTSTLRPPSTAISDLDSALRTLEAQTNPTLAPPTPHPCPCNATRHPLLEAAPNCLSCGKIICTKEGLGPCTSCGTPLLTPALAAAMAAALRDERARERTALNNASQRRADVAGSAPSYATPQRGYAGPKPGEAARLAREQEALEQAQAHRDRLLNFQANNARRTRIVDQAADFETPDAGVPVWAGPAERAARLKKQLGVLRRREKSERGERKVVALEIVGGKLIKRVKRVEEVGLGSESESSESEVEVVAPEWVGGGAFSRNPLVGGLLRPVARVSVEKGKGKVEVEKGTTWRRVQDEADDGEKWILDGGRGGGGGRADEPACG